MFIFTDEQKQVHKDIRRKFRRFMANDDIDVLHVNSFAGSGKSTIIAEELKRSGFSYICLFNNHEITDEQKNKQKPYNNLVHIESRKRLCDIEQFRRAKKKVNIDIGIHCDSCFKKEDNTCEYYNRMNQIKPKDNDTDGISWLGVHHHLAGLVKGYITQYQNTDLVVVDEYFLNALHNKFDIYNTQLNKTISELIDIELPEQLKNGSMILIQLLNHILKVLNSNKIKLDIELVCGLLLRYNEKYSISSLKTIANYYEKHLYYNYIENGSATYNILTNLVHVFLNIYESIQYFDVNQNDYIKNIFKISYDKKKRKHFDIQYFNRSALDLPLPCKFIVLDATTPTTFYREIFNKPVSYLKRKININTVFYQLTTGNYGMTTLDNEISRKKLLNITKKIAQIYKDQNILVVSRMKYKEEIEELADNIITAHYPLVGSNEYDKINVCIVFGTPEPNRDVMKRKSILFGCSIESLYKIEREGYVIQAIHRMRIALKLEEETVVYLLTKMDLPFETKKSSLKELKKLLYYESIGKRFTEIEIEIQDEIIKLIKKNRGKITKTMITRKLKHHNNNKFIKMVLESMIKKKVLKCIKEKPEGRSIFTNYYKLFKK